MRWFAVVGVALLALPLGCLAVAAEPLRVMTFNIRYGTAPDGVHAWENRRELVVQVIREEAPDVLGLQEALRMQVDWLAARLAEYAHVGVGREADGGGEYAPIFYRRDRFDLSDAGTLWLSDTPDVPGSRTWGNSLPRIATWARLLDRRGNHRFLVANTHWDHQSQPARLASGRFLRRRLDELGRDREPTILMGDFNVPSTNPALTALLEPEGPLRDAFSVVHPDETNIGTFNGFGQIADSPKIDAVLASPQWQIEEARIVRTRDGDCFPSDHDPVTATLRLDR